MTDTPARPLGEVLAHAYGDFTPRHPDRPPWHQPRAVIDTVAVTDNRAVVPLALADRVHLHHLDRPTWTRDYLEPFDWTPAGWGVTPGV